MNSSEIALKLLWMPLWGLSISLGWDIWHRATSQMTRFQVSNNKTDMENSNKQTNKQTNKKMVMKKWIISLAVTVSARVFTRRTRRTSRAGQTDKKKTQTCILIQLSFHFWPPLCQQLPTRYVYTYINTNTHLVARLDNDAQYTDKEDQNVPVVADERHEEEERR